MAAALCLRSGRARAEAGRPALVCSRAEPEPRDATRRAGAARRPPGLVVVAALPRARAARPTTPLAGLAPRDVAASAATVLGRCGCGLAGLGTFGKGRCCVPAAGWGDSGAAAEPGAATSPGACEEPGASSAPEGPLVGVPGLCPSAEAGVGRPAAGAPCAATGRDAVLPCVCPGPVSAGPVCAGSFCTNRSLDGVPRIRLCRRASHSLTSSAEPGVNQAPTPPPAASIRSKVSTRPALERALGAAPLRAAAFAGLRADCRGGTEDLCRGGGVACTRGRTDARGGAGPAARGSTRRGVRGPPGSSPGMIGAAAGGRDRTSGGRV